MKGSKNFLLHGFSLVSVLKQGDGSSTEIVKGLDNVIYMRKRIPYTNLPYKNLQELKCEYLPHIYFVAEDDLETIVIEEYIHGSNLQELLDNGTAFTDEQVRKLGVQLCDALITLHRAEILHRDVKPSNIMQTSDSRIKLIDFGAARIVRDGSQDTRLLGTPGFAPPEQFGFATTDKRSDIYALGKTLQALVGNNAGQQLLEIINKCTELDPERRLVSAEEVKKLLLEHKPSHKKYVAFILAALVIGGGALWYQQRDAVQQEQLPMQTQEQADGKSIANNQAVMQEPNSDKSVSDNEVAIQEPNSDKSIADKEATMQKQESKEDKQVNSVAPSDDNVVSVEQNDVDVSLSQASKQVDVEKKTTMPNTEILASDVGFHAQKWVVEKEASSLYWKNIEKARAVGAANVKLEGVPYLVIENKSDKVIHNPYLILDFHDIEVDGKNEVYEIYGNRKEFIEYGKRSKLGYKRIIFRLQGTVLPHDEHAQAVGGNIYLTGNNPRFNVTLMVGNKVLLRDTLKVTIKD